LEIFVRNRASSEYIHAGTSFLKFIDRERRGIIFLKISCQKNPSLRNTCKKLVFLTITVRNMVSSENVLAVPSFLPVISRGN
jgi:hypothetical protein